MGRKKFELKYIENSIARHISFSKRRAGIFQKADALAKLCNVEVAVLINSLAGQPNIFGYPCFEGVVKRLQNPNARKRSSSSSVKQARILKSQAKLDRLTEELKLQKQRENVLKKAQKERLENYDMKEIIHLKLEDLMTFKKMLEDHRNNLKRKRAELEASSSLLMLSKSQKNKKRKMVSLEKFY
ncbi:unnamed protein product [Arabis nemorensis]|uniref:MADS-box domain-containing protein n=1 Tax=Arabis nemorensis TaxID=586526 RepID=A0A565C3C1_9BRAS|nr:unnamed protein product [Arabis nemorensis]